MEESILVLAAVVGTFHALVFVLGFAGLGLLLHLAWKGIQRIKKGQ